MPCCGLTVLFNFYFSNEFCHCCIMDVTTHRKKVHQSTRRVLYVNDLPDWIKNDMRIFADDTKVWSKIRGPKDCIKLQADLNQLLLQFQP